MKDKNLKSAFKEFCRLANAKYSEEAWLNWIEKAIKTIPESYKNKIQ